MALISSKWRKSTYSGGNGGNCVEVGTQDERVLVRDSTDRAGSVLRVRPRTWREFSARLKAGR
ncbi:MAG TPA: DUF397 domain-containing protein [Streptosporangiaceae bacterium]|nr:DUF397 domain-containing protein [Streptosporangiaceae bacterium]